MRLLPLAATVLLSLLSSVNANCDNGSFITPCTNCPILINEGPFISTRAGIPLSENPVPQRFCESKWQEGRVITGIRVWWAKFQIKGIQVQFAGPDGQNAWGTAIHGQSEQDVDDYDERTWESGATIGMKLYNNKPDDGDPMDAVGRIVITEQGKEDWVVGGSKYNKDEIYVNAGSGKLLAIQGGAGAWVTTLEFKFLESTILNLEMTNIKFQEDPEVWTQKKQGFDRVAVSATTYLENPNPINGSTQEMSANFDVVYTTTKTREIEKKFSFGYSLSVSIGGQVGFPLLAEAETEITNTVSYGLETMTKESESKTVTLDNGVSITQTVAPQKALKCSAFATVGTYDSKYEADITASLSNGKVFKYKEFGTFKSQGYAEVNAGCLEIQAESIPAGADVKTTGKPIKRSTRLARFIHEA
ncbi:hypothetical protein DM02DRAFT_655976 [Periconia macrospinosa]|uniref:Jacalin-type lectin domain-containing protein n=1 Tax=Periconia macrospinosa TaxID=97972 RepID=A0A2V1DRF8_9PLEO|nr:hypothetical protein DM02DRAFT_655976 [Periconia macrospinosa]